jgi:phage major head subunit gpT-like protein
MAINTGLWMKAMWPGVNKFFGQEYKEHPVEYTDLFDTFTSRKAWEEDVGTSGFGLFQVKGQGSPIAYDSNQQGFTSRYMMVTYGLGFSITKEAIEDDQYDVIMEKGGRGLAFSIRQTKEILGAQIYDRGFNSSFTGGDGVELFSTVHPNVTGGTYANELSVAADLSEASLEQAVIDLMKLKNDRSLNIAVMPQSLIIPVDLWAEAEKIMRTPTEVGTANNTVNVVRGKFPKGIKINHYLTDTDAWFIRTNVRDGLKYFVRREDTFDMDDDFDTDNAKYKATFRCAFGWTDPRGAFASPGA